MSLRYNRNVLAQRLEELSAEEESEAAKSEVERNNILSKKNNLKTPRHILFDDPSPPNSRSDTFRFETDCKRNCRKNRHIATLL